MACTKRKAGFAYARKLVAGSPTAIGFKAWPSCSRRAGRNGGREEWTAETESDRKVVFPWTLEGVGGERGMAQSGCGGGAATRGMGRRGRKPEYLQAEVAPGQRQNVARLQFAGQGPIQDGLVVADDEIDDPDLLPGQELVVPLLDAAADHQ